MFRKAPDREIVKAWVKAQLKAGVKDVFRKAPDKAMVTTRVKAVLKMSIELHPRTFQAPLPGQATWLECCSVSNLGPLSGRDPY